MSSLLPWPLHLYQPLRSRQHRLLRLLPVLRRSRLLLRLLRCMLPRPPRKPLMPAGPTPDRKVQLVVLGGGPGGYTAAFRAADLGLQVLVIERWETLGGVCLNVGCIPSKALLHAAKVIDEAKSMGGHGVTFGAPAIDLDKLRDWKNSVIRKLTGGLTGLAKTRKVEVVRGVGKFAGSRVIEVAREDGKRELIGFDNCIIAAGSEPVKLPFIPRGSAHHRFHRCAGNWAVCRSGCW